MVEKEEQLIIHISHDMFKPSAFRAIDGLFNVDKIQTQYDTFIFSEPVSYNLTLTNTGDAFLLTGNAKAKAKTACSRCLEEVNVNLEATIDSYYLIDSPQDSKDNEINEFEILPEDHNIPLGEILKATIAVDAPSKPLCKDDCKGLCAKCGTNLNKKLCGCKEEPDESNPFAVLKNLKL